ncbi:MAG: GntR family transcriptional regulator [Clostridioides sp.]|nr:GntR family transcriptional regulator [Clostridioides sp.]
MKKANLSEQVYEHIKNMILNLELKPGDHVPEESVAELLGCSRTPIREALRRLESEGLIFLYPKRFAAVAHYDDDAIRNIGELRLAQDILAGQLALYYGSMSDFEELQELVKKCEEGARTGNMYERIKLDIEFHLKIAEISRNKTLIKKQRELYLVIYLIQISKYTDVEHSMQQIQHHQEILEALVKHDAKTLKKLICAHLKEFFNISDTLIKEFL